MFMQQASLSHKHRNRHLPGWRFLRFTMIVTVNCPICNVIRIYTPPFEGCSETAPLVPNSVPGEIIPVFAKKHKGRSLDKRGAAGYYNV